MKQTYRIRTDCVDWINVKEVDLVIVGEGRVWIIASPVCKAIGRGGYDIISYSRHCYLW